MIKFEMVLFISGKRDAFFFDCLKKTCRYLSQLELFIRRMC